MLGNGNIRRAIMFMLIVSIIFTGCSKPANDDEQTSKIGTEDIKEVTEAVLVDNYEPPALEIGPGIEGNVEFIQDNFSAVSLDYVADGQPQSLELIDANGLKWHLEIPGNALLEDTKISMTPLTNIKNSTLGEIKSGVQLAPDGLQFSKPATLTVTGFQNSKPIMFSGNHDGSELDFAFAEETEGGVSSKILHFSNAYADDPSDNELSQLEKLALKRCKETEKEVLQLLKEPLEVPKPPSISVRCKSDAEAANDGILVDSYIKAFEQPESRVFQTFVSACRDYALISGINYDEDFALAKKLVKRLVNKANRLIREYKPQEDKLIAVSQAALIADRSYTLIAGENPGFIDIIAEWTQMVVEKFFKELREQHDYCLVTPIVRLGRTAALLGGGKDSFFDELEAALSFRYEFETVLTGNGFTYKLKGEAPIQIKLEKSNIVFGSGVGEYTSFSGPEVNMKLPNSFNFDCAVERFNACENDSFIMYVDVFGAKNETLVVDGISVNVTGVVHPTVAGAFISKVSTASDASAQMQKLFYGFEVALQNKNENAADQGFSGTLGNMSVNYRLRLVHTPK